MDRLRLLKEYFGHEHFRPGQEELIDALLSGKDVVGVMPTGAGKSVCYQLPALMLPGLTLVISPLISLMKDQVTALNIAGIAAAYINSSLTAQQYREVFARVENREYKILYVAPERLLTGDFQELVRNVPVSLVAVDEAHCVSQWGQDFRPGYLDIRAFIEGLPTRPAVGAFTATATERVKTDIVRLLDLREPLTLTTGFDRPNLFFEVVRPRSKDVYLKAFLAERPEQSGIVYCSTRRTVEKVCAALVKAGIPATRYHAGLSDAERRQNQEDFIYDRARVMAATNAFGMGIDKSNVSFVVHYNMPKNIESYYQEAGRAGRDGSAARCVLLYSAGDAVTARYLIENGEENEALNEDERALVRERELERLAGMVAYCKSSGCLRKQLLGYFGEAAPERCGNCGSCNAELESRDITIEAQKILSAVYRVEKKYPSSLGTTLITQMLLGKHGHRLLELGLNTLSTYGIMKDVERTEIKEYIDFLTNEGYIRLDGDFKVLRLTDRAREVLFHGERVTLTRRARSAAETARPQRKRDRAERLPRTPSPEEGLDEPPQLDYDGELLDVLRELRTALARKQSVPAYIIFSNATLEDMAAKRPVSLDEFMAVSGVGRVKAARYGENFIAAIRQWTENG